MPGARGIVVFSGGSAANNLVDVFEAVRVNKDCPLSYIIPISDNGGSSSELIRFFGGPGIGDVRSRLVRLIPSSPPSPERDATSILFNHRLSSTSSSDAADEWQAIVAGTASLWNGIPFAKKELIRAFLNTLNMELLKRARPPTSTFDFTSASIGNLFLTGARLFSGSFESAIYLLSSMCSIPDDLVRVIPSISSNFSHHIAAGLANGDTIVGQNNISHPTSHTSLLMPSAQGTSNGVHKRYSIDHADDLDAEDANIPGTLPTLRQRNIKFSKEQDEDLPARIDRIWYINPFGQEMLPPANPRALAAVNEAQAVIFSIGSLYTSLIPSVVLRGMGNALRSTAARHKILILNGCLDREVGPFSQPFSAFDFVEAIAKAGEQSREGLWNAEANTSHSSEYTTQSTTPLRTPQNEKFLSPDLAAQVASRVTRKSSIYRQYVTHVIHLTGEGTPAVDREQLASLGIDCLKLYGRKNPKASGMLYDSQALIGAIEAILGRKGDAMTTSRSRRNTLDASSKSASILQLL
jgi:2-phospho-L-lactate transferase/gluconeogenesis factor (CofD/UPF0052 family)